MAAGIGAVAAGAIAGSGRADSCGSSGSEFRQTSSEVGRYQIQDGFLVDTVTGRVWKHHPKAQKFVEIRKTIQPILYELVEDNLRVRARDEAVRVVASLGISKNKREAAISKEEDKLFKKWQNQVKKHK